MRTGEHGMSVKKACGALGVSRGGYYAFPNRPKSSRQIAREVLEPFVEDIFYANNRRYGSRRIVVSDDIPHQVELSAPPLHHRAHWPEPNPLNRDGYRLPHSDREPESGRIPPESWDADPLQASLLSRRKNKIT